MLYVSDVDPKRADWLAYDVQLDGTVANGRVLFDATHWRKDPFFGPDGFKVGSTEKYLWRVSRRHHRDRAGRDLLGTIETGRPTSNVAWRRRPHVVCDRRDVGLSNQTHDERRRILMPSGANEVRHRKAQLLGLLDQTLIGHLVELVRARENPQKAAIRRAHH